MIQGTDLKSDPTAWCAQQHCDLKYLYTHIGNKLHMESGTAKARQAHAQINKQLLVQQQCLHFWPLDILLVI